jgi:hypothetical protein
VELSAAHKHLSSLLTAETASPRTMKIAGSGNLSHGGHWSLRSEEDPRTGLVQLLIEAHFALPADVIERCLIDERVQATFDNYIVEKKVLHKDIVKNLALGVDGVDNSYKATDVIYHQMTFPRPMRNRDYVSAPLAPNTMLKFTFL